MRPLRFLLFIPLALLILFFSARTVSAQSGIVTVGDGTAASCNSFTLDVALNNSGITDLTFNCGVAPLSIPLSTMRLITNNLKINGGNRITLVAPTNSRHFEVNFNAVLTLEDITLTNGNTPEGYGGAVHVLRGGGLVANRVRFLNNRSLYGGAVAVNYGSSAQLNSSLLSQNTAINDGGAVFSRGPVRVQWTDISKNTAGRDGGGIAHDAPVASAWLEIFRSLVAENTATGSSSRGGGVYIYGPAEIDTSTITLNTSAQGAGIYAFNSTPYVNFSTITNNSSITGSSGLFGFGAVFYLSGSIIAYNSPANCIPNTPITSSGYNLENTNQCGFNSIGDISNANPMLDRLRFNGGPTRTILLKAGSPALDTGNPAGCGQFDQRGFYGSFNDISSRAADGNGDSIARCDIGAFERLPSDIEIKDLFLPMIIR